MLIPKFIGNNSPIPPDGFRFVLRQERLRPEAFVSSSVIASHNSSYLHFSRLIDQAKKMPFCENDKGFKICRPVISLYL